MVWQAARVEAGDVAPRRSRPRAPSGSRLSQGRGVLALLAGDWRSARADRPPPCRGAEAHLKKILVGAPSGRCRLLERHGSPGDRRSAPRAAASAQAGGQARLLRGPDQPRDRAGARPERQRGATRAPGQPGHGRRALRARPRQRAPCDPGPRRCCLGGRRLGDVARERPWPTSRPRASDRNRRRHDRGRCRAAGDPSSAVARRPYPQAAACGSRRVSWRQPAVASATTRRCGDVAHRRRHRAGRGQTSAVGALAGAVPVKVETLRSSCRYSLTSAFAACRSRVLPRLPQLPFGA